MANGKKHARATRRTLWTLGIISTGLIIYYQQWEMSGLYIGAILGHILTPDIDHHFVTYEEHRMYRINQLFGTIWYYYWAPYQWAFSHRGISHIMLLGTLTRFIYLLWYPLMAYPQFVVVYVYMFIAWSIQDYMHLILDI